jgi:hypothetical protein
MRIVSPLCAFGGTARDTDIESGDEGSIEQNSEVRSQESEASRASNGDPAPAHRLNLSAHSDSMLSSGFRFTPPIITMVQLDDQANDDIVV